MDNMVNQAINNWLKKAKNNGVELYYLFEPNKTDYHQIKMIYKGQELKIVIEAWTSFRNKKIPTKESFLPENDLVRVKKKLTNSYKTQMENWLFTKLAVFKIIVEDKNGKK